MEQTEKIFISESELEFIASEYSPSDEIDKAEGRLTAGKIAGRIALSFFTVLFLAIFALYMVCYTISTGPSVTFRDTFVLSQGTATKWVPFLFLDEDTVNGILENSENITVDVMSAEDFAALHQTDVSDPTVPTVDEWEGSVDGIKVFTESGDTFKAYIMLVKDPSRIFVGTSSENYQNATEGMTIFDITKKYGVVAGINGGEFADAGGMGNGGRPMGLTYSRGECVWNDSLKRTFIGFDSNNKLVVANSMTYARAQALGIRDAVSFQNNNVLIESSDGNVNLHYENSNKETAQRTAIGQRADGTVILIVTDGRSASSIGATHDDMIDMMVSLGAVNAAMLDGGSSAVMYYENYFNVFDEFSGTSLDKYQEKGLINKYKAFSSPRPIPTFFLIGEGDAE
ncbi:MAG: phosphodiester glycosidase family protein [Ruminococcaceae bacterium]|nr:phosphodiester glycosidase family protein [Oscillospiraceae bacterium]